MQEYDHKKVEKKWQEVWEEESSHKTDDNSSKPKYYPLVEFPYPSGDGLHVGHPRPYIGLDVVARKRRMEGFNVLYPMGWDAFGLPAENYAVKTGTHPKITTERNIKRFKEQIQSLGISFDWSREVATTDPKYYKWTQWIFLKLFENGLAYKKKMPINWCPSCKIGLANEEVVGGACERCGAEVEKREKEQWMLTITKYAERLLEDLEPLDYIEPVKIQQRNWIGRSEGVEIEFQIKDSKFKIPVFTTRPDTLFGVTYVVLAPEHELIHKLEDQTKNLSEVKSYVDSAKNKTEIERTAEGKEKTGVELEGVKVINPANQEEIPIYVADYVLSDYGTGAVMGVPGHDERDFEFALKFHLKVVQVIDLNPSDFDFKQVASGTGVGSFVGHPIEFQVTDKKTGKIVGWKYENINEACHTCPGKLINSGKFNGIESNDAKEKITKFVGGEIKTTYKLRDWVFSRQRYWGEPIPIILCSECGPVAVSEDDLPVELPEVEDFMPNDQGESPLSKATDWVNTKCPKCGSEAKRETDVMPNWAGSSWYFLRYLDPKNDKEIADKKKIEHWMPVDWYNGGMEHTTLHLLYSRFWHKFLYDIGVANTPEPYSKRTSHGLIMGEDGEKMSKSRGNVINPDDIVERFGADTLRVYEMFMGPFNQAIAWSTDGLMGPRRFLEKIWRASENLSEGEGLISLQHETIKKITNDIEEMKFNTAISTLMTYFNEISKDGSVSIQDFKILLLLLSPFAPHITEELWQKVGEKTTIYLTPWPAYDKTKIVKNEWTIIVQVNGKIRGEFQTEELDEKKIIDEALSLERVKEYLKGKEVKKSFYVEGKLVNIVAG